MFAETAAHSSIVAEVDELAPDDVSYVSIQALFHMDSLVDAFDDKIEIATVQTRRDIAVVYNDLVVGAGGSADVNV
jgi:hypothetical protein